MKIPRIYLPVPLRTGTSVALTAAAFHHAVRVLRLASDAPITLFNGAGGEFRAMLERVERREATARVEAFVAREAESPLEIVLLQGISRGERMDYTLQKAVELGVSAIVPALAERSVASLSADRLAKRLEHWRGIVIGACEQCGRNRLPPVLEPVGLGPGLERYRPAGLALVLDPQARQGLRTLSRPPGPIALLVGPEGGLTRAEIASAAAAGFAGVRLGPRVMRTETAGIAALAVLQVLWGDLG